VARLLRMPGVSAGADEAVLAQWLVEESADFGAMDAIATVETDKALVDVEADAAGVVLKTLVDAGAQVEVGAPIAVLGDPGEVVDDLAPVLASLGVDGAEVGGSGPGREESVASAATEGDGAAADPPSVDPESGAPVAEAARDSGDAPEVPVGEPGPAPGGERADRASRPPGARIFASPLARRLARDAGIPLEEIPGTGPRNRVLRRDVERAVAARTEAPPPGRSEEQREPVAPAASVGAGGEPAYEEVPHSRFRRAVAERLATSKQEAPHFYVRGTVRAERLLALRAELNDDPGIQVSLNDLVVRAVAVAHRRVPELNVTWTDEAVRVWRRVDVGVAVATERGLLTPVLRDVGSRTITDLADATRDLADRAREGRLRQEELEGGSIAVTNLGMYGVEEFAAIINPPHAAILAVGGVRDQPVVEDGAVVPGRVMALTLSVDHRPVDGVVAARWMAALTDVLEHPARALA
jgi:pyruvate dehydrogenase E2 component (dihydrolipoamide acetyltransferase)